MFAGAGRWFQTSLYSWKRKWLMTISRKGQPHPPSLLCLFVCLSPSSRLEKIETYCIIPGVSICPDKRFSMTNLSLPLTKQKVIFFSVLCIVYSEIVGGVSCAWTSFFATHLGWPGNLKSQIKLLFSFIAWFLLKSSWFGEWVKVEIILSFWKRLTYWSEFYLMDNKR